MKKLSIVIPFYNEEKNIPLVLEAFNLQKANDDENTTQSKQPKRHLRRQPELLRPKIRKGGSINHRRHHHSANQYIAFHKSYAGFA